MSDADDTGRGDWSAPGAPDADQQDTTWVEHAPTAPVGPDPETVVLGAQPTVVDATLPPPPPPPAWSSPASPAPAAPAPPVGPRPVGPPPSWGPPSGPPTGVQPWSGAALPGVAGWGAVPVAPKPGVVPLRPLGLGEILDGAISYIRRDPRTVLGIAAVISLITAALQFVALLVFGTGFLNLSTSTGPLDETALVSSLTGLVSAIAVTTVISFVLQITATGMLTVAMSRAVLGRRVTASEAWALTRPRLLALVGVTLLVGLTVSLAFLGGLAVAIGLGALVATSVDPAAGFLLGFALGAAAIVLSIWLAIRLLLAPVIVVLEKAGVVQSMRRSTRLVTGAWWRTFGIYTLTVFLSYLLSQALSFPAAIIAGLLPFATGPDSAGIVLAVTSSLSSLIAGMITLPFLAGVTSLLYIDRRIRREALDLELQRASAAGV